MFQYALGKTLALRYGAELVLDIFWFSDMGESTPRHYMLDAFSVADRFATKDEIMRLSRTSNSLVRKIFRKLSLASTQYIKEPHYAYWAGIENISPPVLLKGYWQNELYFNQKPDVIRKVFSFPDFPTHQAKVLAEQITACPNAVSVHLRRGDYVSNSKVNQHHGLCSPEYYATAMRFLRENIAGDLHLFIFSDEPDWAKAHFSTPGFPSQVVDFPEFQTTPWHDMHLMSLCKHHIIANSSFSWWGAWLSGDQGVICAPKVWVASEGRANDSPVPDRWVRF